ncbi:MAG: transglutaminase domain-containing protein [Candidatus Aminicenantales bacterium]
MIRIRKIVGVGLTALMLCLTAAAQTSVEKELQDSSQELARLYTQKNWAGALRVIDRQLELADRLGNKDIRAGILYNKACVHALAGQKSSAIIAIRESVASGYTDYVKYAGDPDFDSLRGELEFKSILADLKAKYGPQPLEWDRTQSPPAFSVTYDTPQVEEFQELRREFSVDSVVAGAKDDYERLLRLTHWVSTRWEHSPDQMASKSDPLTILREAEKGGRFICREYAIVLAGVANAYGMPARVLNLLPREVETRSEAHSVAEVWLEQFHKWVLADGQYGAIGELGGVPLNGIELQKAFAEDKPVKCVVGAEVAAEWKPFILRNAFYFKFGDNQRSFHRGTNRQLVLVPKGAPEPHKFAGGNEAVFAGAVYTSNPDTFYAPPPKVR